MIKLLRTSLYRSGLFFGLIILLGACTSSNKKKQKKDIQDAVEEVVDLDLDQILERGYITAIVDNSSTGLFLYKGRPMGYEYELLSIFADSIGIELKLEITPSLEKAFQKLNSGEGDILAHNLTVTKERQERIGFTNYHNIVRQVLVQRKPDNWRKMKLHEIEQTMLRTPIELIGKEIHVRSSSAYTSRLRNLSDEIGGDIIIIEEAEDIETEKIIQKVAEREIDYTVVDENIALVNARYYPNLDIKTPVSLPQQIAWGVRKNSDSLLTVLNDWIFEMKKTPEYYTIYNKYFKNTRRSKSRVESDFFSAGEEYISPYDSLIKLVAQDVGWDWMLLAAQISKESKFDPKAESWAGAVGLMQILPKNGEEYGVKDLTDPTQNLTAGKKHLQWLEGIWQSAILDSLERKKFILASYNVGQGHVQDAVRLAKKFGLDTAVWENNVEKALLLKSSAKYYKDDVVKFGYCRCTEPIDYVEDIMKLYSEYKQIVDVN
ncbi:MAG: transporter substrate-binding domain-containing protein [Cyclobacteriaceae bacterium]